MGNVCFYFFQMNLLLMCHERQTCRCLFPCLFPFKRYKPFHLPQTLRFGGGGGGGSGLMGKVNEQQRIFLRDLECYSPMCLYFKKVKSPFKYENLYFVFPLEILVNIPNNKNPDPFFFFFFFPEEPFFPLQNNDLSSTFRSGRQLPYKFLPYKFLVSYLWGSSHY